MSDQEKIELIRKLYDAYIRSQCAKEVVIEHLAMEYSATLVRKALTGHKVEKLAA